MHIFAEKLSLRTFLSINILIKERNYNCKDVHLKYIYIDGFLAWITQISPNLNLGSVKVFDFNFDSLVDEKGVNLGKKVVFKDLEEIYQMIEKNIDISNQVILKKDMIWFKAFLKKKVTLLEPFSNAVVNRLINILIMFQAVAFYKNKLNCDEPPSLMLEKKPWINELCEYGESKGIKITENKFNEIYLSQEIFKFIKRNRWFRLFKSYFYFYLNRNAIKENNTNVHPSVVIDQVLQRYNHNIIWESKYLPSTSINFVSKSHPINHEYLYELKKNGMNFIALNRKIGRGLDIPVFLSRVELFEKNKGENKEQKIINNYYNDYVSEKKYWSEFFSKINAKIYLTCHKWAAHPLAAAAAINERDGISAVFQVSYSEFPCAYALINADVFFSISKKAPLVEIKQGSKINYNVCIGNLDQSRNKFLKEDADKLRKQLQNNGAEKIISFLDQDSNDDHRWGTVHSVTRENYQYLLRKVMEEKWLGLIIKPKKPKNIRKVLGDVNNLLDQALATGRCYLFENSNSFSSKNYINPPSQSAMASDIAIQDDLIAGTAGVDAVLTGTPTLMMDRYGFHESQIYKLGVGKVVFNDWPILWNNLEKHWRKEPIDGFGDWSPILDDIDPFRDEKASTRLTKFLYYLTEGFREGLSKKENLENAVGLYSSEWGEDKVYQYKNPDF